MGFNGTYIKEQAGFVLRIRYFPKISRAFRYAWFSFLGMKIGKGTVLPAMTVSWPHQVAFGNHCNIEKNVKFKFDGIHKPGPSICIGDRVFIGYSCEFNIRKEISIGPDCLIASGCKFIDHDHGIAIGSLMREQHGIEQSILIHENVWLGANVIVLKGVEIGSGAIVAAGAVVVKSIPENEIWAGIPAKKIGLRT